MSTRPKGTVSTGRSWRRSGSSSATTAATPIPPATALARPTSRARPARVRATARARVPAVVTGANERQGRGYGPGGHPDPRGVAEEDCSSTLNYLLYRAAIRPIAEIVRDNPLARDYTSWGAPGAG